MTGELKQLKLEQIRTKREAAARARQLAAQLGASEDRERALVFAAELDAQAEELESEIGVEAVPAPKVVQTQVQLQQGPPAKDPDEDNKP